MVLGKNQRCEKQLIKFVTDILNEWDRGVHTDACILDFSKTSNKVKHQKLLLKLANLGISFQVTA